MPITKSAKKAFRSSEAKRARNQKQKKSLEIQLKKVSKETLSKTVSLIDKASKRGLIHVNKAARLKSQLSKKYSGHTATKRAGAGQAPVKKTAVTKAAPAKKKTPTKPAGQSPLGGAKTTKKA